MIVAIDQSQSFNEVQVDGFPPLKRNERGGHGADTGFGGVSGDKLAMLAGR
jgi:hypothetical protein